MFLCMQICTYVCCIYGMKPGPNVVCRNSELRSQLEPKVYVDKRQRKDKCQKMSFVILENVI